METHGRRDAMRRWGRAAWPGGLVLLLVGFAGLGPPPMEPLTATTLAEAARRWEAHGADSYHLVVRVRPPRAKVVLYDVVVAGGELVGIERDGQGIRPEDAVHHDYSVSGLFALLGEDLRLVDVPQGNTPPLDLRARFEPETGRLVRYRRTVGSARRRVLLVEVLEYEPLGA